MTESIDPNQKPAAQPDGAVSSARDLGGEHPERPELGELDPERVAVDGVGGALAKKGLETGTVPVTYERHGEVNEGDAASIGAKGDLLVVAKPQPDAETMSSKVHPAIHRVPPKDIIDAGPPEKDPLA